MSECKQSSLESRVSLYSVGGWKRGWVGGYRIGGTHSSSSLLHLECVSGWVGGWVGGCVGGCFVPTLAPHVDACHAFH